MRRLVGVALMVDGVWTLLWFSGLLSGLGSRPGWSVTLILVRVLAAAIATAGGWLVSQRRAPGEGMAVVALMLTTGVEGLAAMAGGLPINYDPVWRWPFVGLYGAAAVTVGWWADRVRRRERDDI
jgi:hypothetical protein